MKRTSLKRKTPLKSGKPLARGTSKLKRTPMKRGGGSKSVIPNEVREIVRCRSGGVCEATDLIHGCDHVAVHMHHILLRSLGGKHAADNLMHVCAPAHAEIHAKPALSFELGYLRHSWEA